MEVKNLEDYVKVFENFLPDNLLEALTKICINSDKFKDADILGPEQKGGHINKHIRDTFRWTLKGLHSQSLTEVHWTNVLCYFFKNAVEKYLESFEENISFQVIDIQILKYKIGGHYKFHIDSHAKIPRTFSCIFLINDNYEGGDLVFKYPDSAKQYTIKRKKNTMIVWPSNFLFPHSVKPVIKGERYSIVSWAV
jgi:hypothetical protein